MLFMIDKNLLAFYVAGKSSNTIIHGDDIRIKASDKKIQRGQRCDFTAGGNIDIHWKVATELSG